MPCNAGRQVPILFRFINSLPRHHRPIRTASPVLPATFHSGRSFQDGNPSSRPSPETSSPKNSINHFQNLSQAVPNALNLPTGLADALSASPLLGAAFTALVGLGVVFGGGAIYVKWYKHHVLDKMVEAFEPGFDPALQLADHGAQLGGQNDYSTHMAHVDWASDIRRDEQQVIDYIIHGVDHGHYILLMGSKGVGKTTMIVDAMRRVDADGIAICEAHEDLEVFRLRLGKMGLFQRRDPREGGPRLDIERALNKLEKVALRIVAKRGKPLVLVINNMQLFSNDEESYKLIQQIQQKAESWAESHLVTVVFSTDDFWPYPLMKKIANRMRVISVDDLQGETSLAALRHLRSDLQGKVENDTVLREALKISGDRLSHLNHLAHSKDLLDEANSLLELETGWLLSKVGLIPNCDDDAMDEQKVSSCTWLLLREFVKQYRENEAQALAIAAESGQEPAEVELPMLPYYRVRQIMTRADFVEQLDHLNIVAIDTKYIVRPDSMVLLRAAINIVEEKGFDELLDAVRGRIDEIESLHRTRELTWKASPEGDLFRIQLEPYSRNVRNSSANKAANPSRWFW